jgi:hypothetical protein
MSLVQSSWPFAAGVMLAMRDARLTFAKAKDDGGFRPSESTALMTVS